MLISAVTPFMSIYHLPQGQYGYKGHVINMPQDLSVFTTSLPRLPSELDVIIVRKKGSNNTHCDFRVRRMVVQRALQWLKRNNKYYRNIDIDVSVLSQLPDDGDLTDKCGVGIEDTAEKQEEEELPSEDTDPTDVATFIPVVARKMTEKETIRKSVHHRQPTKDQIVPWPENGSVPIDEFKTEGYISCAFPTLFPTGEADYLAPRLQSVTVGMYFKHLMMYGEGRFAKHPRFRYFALNTEMRWRALQTGRVYINQHLDDARLTLDDLRDMVGHEGEFFTHRVMHFASSLRGTSQFWFKQRSRLISMVDTLGMPTVFFTHSAADGQWPELARLICLASSVQTRKTAVPVAARRFQTTLPLLTGSFTTASASLLTRSTQMSWEQSTSGTGVSGSTEGVPTCTALHGLLMLLMSSICLQPRTTLISSEVWRISQATLTALSAPSTLPFRRMETTQRMLPYHKQNLTCATSLTQRWKTSRWT